MIQKLKSLAEYSKSNQKLKVAIVRSNYHQDLTKSLERSCRKHLIASGVAEENITTFEVPGSWEIPLTTKNIAKSKKFDGIVTFGIIIKGETYHFEILAEESARALMDISLKFNVPITFGILTTYNLEQAKKRSSGKHNKGIEAAKALLNNIQMTRQIYNGRDINVLRVSAAMLPTVYGSFKIIIYKSPQDQIEHVVLVKGTDFKKTSLVRIHSRCLTGDVFSSLRCDCKDQLKKSLIKISKAKNGVLIYLNQEGRGIGLTNKIKAYSLQEKGLDTVDANNALGLPSDARDYMVAVDILKDLGIETINLLTNNPDKIDQLAQYGIIVNKRIPLEVNPNKKNKSYLKTKKDKLGHKLSLV